MTAMTEPEMREAVRDSYRRMLRDRIAADLKWLRAALDEMERGTADDYKHAASEARNAAQHLVSIGTDAGRLAVLNEETAWIASRALAAAVEAGEVDHAPAPAQPKHRKRGA